MSSRLPRFSYSDGLVTLISSPPEVQWVALRNINLLLQKRPEILSNEMRVFFCKYNDPPYVKVEKLDIMVRLASERNVDILLGELKEYASEVDVDFVRKAVRAVGQTAIKIEQAADKCVSVLMELIETRVSYVVQEAVIVIKVSRTGCKRDCTDASRTFSGNTLTPTRALSLLFAQI